MPLYNIDSMTRAEHLAWAKQRALDCIDSDGPATAWASMVSDLGKHSKLANHTGLGLGSMLLIAGHNNSPEAMREFIEGMN